MAPIELLWAVPAPQQAKLNRRYFEQTPSIEYTSNSEQIDRTSSREIARRRRRRLSNGRLSLPARNWRLEGKLLADWPSCYSNKWLAQAALGSLLARDDNGNCRQWSPDAANSNCRRGSSKVVCLFLPRPPTASLWLASVLGRSGGSGLSTVSQDRTGPSFTQTLPASLTKSLSLSLYF